MTDSDTAPTCTICLQELANQPVSALHCRHVYHHACIVQWVQEGPRRRCPLCNFPASTDDIVGPLFVDVNASFSGCNDQSVVPAEEHEQLREELRARERAMELLQQELNNQRQAHSQCANRIAVLSRRLRYYRHIESIRNADIALQSPSFQRRMSMWRDLAPDELVVILGTLAHRNQEATEQLNQLRRQLRDAIDQRDLYKRRLDSQRSQRKSSGEASSSKGPNKRTVSVRDATDVGSDDSTTDGEGREGTSRVAKRLRPNPVERRREENEGQAAAQGSSTGSTDSRSPTLSLTEVRPIPRSSGPSVTRRPVSVANDEGPAPENDDNPAPPFRGLSDRPLWQLGFQVPTFDIGDDSDSSVSGGRDNPERIVLSDSDDDEEEVIITESRNYRPPTPLIVQQRNNRARSSRAGEVIELSSDEETE